MKLPRILLPLLLVSARASLVAAQAPDSTYSPDSGAIVSWIRANAIPLRSVRPSDDFSDMQPLKQAFADARIVGLGEASHGTSEFQQAKHRLLEFLVTQMGFTAFTMEAAYSDAQPINEYILHGKGNRATVLTGQGYVGWDTEEFSAMLDWLRRYNRTVPEAKKVRFYGLDLYRNRVGRQRVMKFVRAVAPELTRPTDSLFRVLAEQEAKWPLWDTTVIASARPRVAALSDALVARRTAVADHVAPAEYDEILHFIDVMREGISQEDRSRHMAENLVWLVDHERPGTKFVFWAHNFHVATGTPIRESTAGTYLRKVYGSAYYPVALDFDHGSYLSRSFPPPGDFKPGTFPPSAPGSFEWYMSHAGASDFFLDLRHASPNASVDKWLHTPQKVHAANWAYSDPAKLFLPLNVGDWYDGILFIAESTPTHPTPNARHIVSLHRGF